MSIHGWITETTQQGHMRLNQTLSYMCRSPEMFLTFPYLIRSIGVNNLHLSKTNTREQRSFVCSAFCTQTSTEHIPTNENTSEADYFLVCREDIVQGSCVDLMAEFLTHGLIKVLDHETLFFRDHHSELFL